MFNKTMQRRLEKTRMSVPFEVDGIWFLFLMLPL